MLALDRTNIIVNKGLKGLVVSTLALFVSTSNLPNASRDLHASGDAIHGVMWTQSSDTSESVWRELRLRAAAIRTTVDDEAWASTLIVRSGHIILRLPDVQRIDIASDLVTTVGYWRETFRDTIINGGSGLIPLPAPGRGVFGKTGVHLISIEFKESTGRHSGVLLEAKKDDYQDILRAIARVTRQPVSIAAADRDRLPREVPTIVVETPPSGVLPDVPMLPVRRLSGPVESVAISPDGAVIATGHFDGAIQFWHMASGIRDQPPLKTKLRGLRGMMFGADGRTLTTWSWFTPALLVWDVTRRAKLAEIPLPLDYLDQVVFSPDRRLVAVIGRRQPLSPKALIVVDLMKGRVIFEPTLQTEPKGVAFQSAGHLMLAWEFRAIHVWHTDSFVLAGAFQSAAIIDAATLTAEGTEILATGRDGTLKRIDVTTGDVAAITHISGPHTATFATQFSTDGRLLAFVDSPRSVSLWDTNTPDHAPMPLVGHRGLLVDVVFNPSGELLATATPGHVVVWNTHTQQAVGQCLTGPVRQFGSWTRSGDTLTKVWFTPDGGAIAITREGEQSSALCDLHPPTSRSH